MKPHTKKREKRKIQIIISVLLIFIIIYAINMNHLNKCFTKLVELPPISSTSNTKIKHTANLSNDWNLILVNSENALPDNLNISLIKIENDYRIDKRIYDSYNDMQSAANKDGVALKVNSAYRTYDEQQLILNEKINELKKQGFSFDKAKNLAVKQVANPGTSEHETGLALDIVSKNNDNWTVYSWLSKNAYKYGFVLRYPKGKENITGIDYEPWHYRYVGIQAALKIYQQGLCLEEYLN